LNDNGSSRRCGRKPEYKSDGKVLDFNSLVALFKSGDLEKQFRAFFPALTEEDQNCLEKKHFNFDELPYQLKIENISGYMEDCHFCGNSYCRSNCPLPYSSK